MRYCSYCGQPIQDGYLFCGSCGKPVTTETTTKTQQKQTKSSGSSDSSWVNHLNDYVGNDRPADLNWKILFTDVSKKHTTEEAEEIFIVGTRKTTPSVYEVSKDWPHPWL